MRIGTSHKLSQSMTLSPRLAYAIKLLSLSALELEGHVSKMAAENPFLEEPERQENIQYGIAPDRVYFGGYAESQSNDPITNLAAAPVSLAESLKRQLFENQFSKNEIAIGLFLFGQMDANGFLPTSFLDAAFNKFGDRFSPKEIVSVQKKLTRLDPVGICSRNLSECLMAQLRDKGFSKTSLPYRILLEGKEQLKNKNINALSANLKTSTTQARKALSILEKLNPYPAIGGNQNQSLSENVLPEIFVENKSGHLHLSFSETCVPELKTPKYAQNIVSNASNKDAIEFLNKKRAQAEWVIKSIYQRQSNIRKIVQVIVNIQKNWFLCAGPLVPMKLEDVANSAGVHISTVSRICNGKYIQSTRGTHELKYFLSTGLHSNSSTGQHSNHEVKRIIKKAIDAEIKQRPLSDSELTAIIQCKNIRVARRTVAKYREALKIPKASLRRVI